MSKSQTNSNRIQPALKASYKERVLILSCLLCSSAYDGHKVQLKTFLIVVNSRKGLLRQILT